MKNINKVMKVNDVQHDDITNEKDNEWKERLCISYFNRLHI